ncbi:MAG: hypothetical protein IBJ02_06430 [Brevundimonas sp.]|nr:hypothetical protein [Brevundimonas sp.]
MTIRILLVGLVVAWVATLAGLAWMMSIARAGPEDVGFLLMYSDIVLKICAFLAVASTVVGVVSARPQARIGVCAALVWGVLGGLYGAAYARSGLINMNPPIPFEVYAPSYAQALLVLLIGLTGAILTTLTGLRRPS